MKIRNTILKLSLVSTLTFLLINSVFAGVVSSGQTISGLSGGSNYYSIFIDKNTTSFTITIDPSLTLASGEIFAQIGKGPVDLTIAGKYPMRSKSFYDANLKAFGKVLTVDANSKFPLIPGSWYAFDILQGTVGKPYSNLTMSVNVVTSGGGGNSDDD